jgi:hypothetical protein
LAKRTGTRALAARSKIAPRLDAAHPDYSILSAIETALLTAAGGANALKTLLGGIIRDSIDRVIQTPKTGRRFYDDLEPTEKTYIGTCVEIELRSGLSLRRGPSMDLLVAGHDTDVKFSRLFGGWMIPEEAYGKACILISANDEISRFYMGLLVAHVEYLRIGKNKDKKLGLKAAERNNILWLFQDEPYTENFWLSVDPGIIKRISDGTSGNARMITFLSEVLDKPFSRKIVADVGAQDDFMRRIRADTSNNKGTREAILRNHILLLHGFWKDERELIQKLGIGPVGTNQYVAHKLRNAAEIALAKQYGYDV